MGTLLYATPLQSTLLYSTQTPRKPARKNTLAGLQVLLRSHLPPKKVGPLGKGNGNACKRPSDQVGEPLRFKEAGDYLTCEGGGEVPQSGFVRVL